MIEKTIFIAFDGKQFEDINDCKEYEFKERYKNLKYNTVKMWDKNKNPIPSDKWEEDFESAYYIQCTNEAGCDYIKALGEQTECSNPFDDYNTYDYPNGGLWHYENYHGSDWFEYSQAKKEFDDTWSGLE